jgi:hypothetical protein
MDYSIHHRAGYRTIVNLTVIGFALPFALLAVSLAMYLKGLSARVPIRPLNAIALGPLCRCDRVSLPAFTVRLPPPRDRDDDLGRRLQREPETRADRCPGRDSGGLRANAEARVGHRRMAESGRH